MAICNHNFRVNQHYNFISSTFFPPLNPFTSTLSSSISTMKIILRSLQIMSLTFTLQFAIRWIKMFLLHTIVILDWIYSVVYVGNVIVFKTLIGIVFLKLGFRGISVLRVVCSFKTITNRERDMQGSTSLLQRKIFERILNRNLLPK